jgi:ATP-binding protein involved in chromosome partitioning
LQRQGFRVGLLDADIYGPSVPMMLGIKGPLQVSPTNQLIPVVGHGIKAVSLGLISDVRAPAIWRGPMVAKALEQLVYDVEWSPLDYLIIDLPPGTGDVQLTLIENVPLTGAVIVSTPQDVALIDAHKAVSMFYKLSIPILGLVENMAFHTCSNCGHEDPVFGKDRTDLFATERDIPILARLPIDRQVRIGGDLGQPVAAQMGSDVAPLFEGLAKQIFAATVTVKDGLSH